MSLYDFSELGQGANIVDWLVIINSWSNGTIFAGFTVAIVLLIFGVMKLQQVETDNAVISAGFIGFLISGLFWLIDFNGMRLVPTIIPFLLIIITGIGLFMKMIRDWL